MAITAGRIALALAAAMLLFHPVGAPAAEIKALITIGMLSAVEELVPRFEKASGHKVVITFGLSAPLTKRIQEGETADLLIAARNGIDSLIKGGKVVAGSDATLARSGVGIAVRKGDPKPDISTSDALKRALLAARAIGYSNPAAGGASGVHFASVIARLGIVEEMKSKTKHPPAGGLVGPMLVKGDIDLAVQQIPELIDVNGAELVGPLPGDLQAITVFTGGVPTLAKEVVAARALLDFLRFPEALEVIKAKGMEPG